MTRALNPLPLLEVEEDDDRDIPEEVDFEDSCNEVLKSIGTEDFENMWALMGKTIFSSPVGLQILFCRSVLSKIEEVYSFTPVNPKLEVLEDVQSIYEFLAFIEYNYLEFLTGLFNFLQIPVNKVLDYKILFNTLWNRVSEFLDQFSSANEMITEFLRTYIKEDFVKYLSLITERKKTEVAILVTLKGEKDGRKEASTED